MVCKQKMKTRRWSSGGRARSPKSLEERNEGARRVERVRIVGSQLRLRGFHETSCRDIAAAAGMQPGSLLYFFESKEAMLHAVMKDGMAQATTSQDAALGGLAPRTNSMERLRELMRNHLQILVVPGSDFIPVMLYE